MKTISIGYSLVIIKAINTINALRRTLSVSYQIIHYKYCPSQNLASCSNHVINSYEININHKEYVASMNEQLQIKSRYPAQRRMIMAKG